jgi:acyl carrier protein
MSEPKQTTLERVQAVIADHLGLKPEEVIATASLTEELGADSLDTVEIVMMLEEEFDVEMQEEAANTLQTAAAIAEWFDANSA